MLRSMLDSCRQLLVVTYEYNLHVISLQCQGHDDVWLNRLCSFVNDDGLVLGVWNRSCGAHGELASDRNDCLAQ